MKRVKENSGNRYLCCSLMLCICTTQCFTHPETHLLSTFKVAKPTRGTASTKNLNSSVLQPLDPSASTMKRQEETQKLQQGEFWLAIRTMYFAMRALSIGTGCQRGGKNFDFGDIQNWLRQSPWATYSKMLLIDQMITFSLNCSTILCYSVTASAFRSHT